MNSPRSQPADGSQLGHQAAKSKATGDKIINAVIGMIKESGDKGFSTDEHIHRL
jgi:hypothetical protein